MGHAKNMGNIIQNKKNQINCVCDPYFWSATQIMGHTRHMGNITQNNFCVRDPYFGSATQNMGHARNMGNCYPNFGVFSHFSGDILEISDILEILLIYTDN